MMDKNIIIDQFPAMLTAIDEDGVFQVWNQQCVDITGYSADFVIGNDAIVKLLLPNEEQRQEVIELVKNKTDLNTELNRLQLQCADGTIKLIRLVLRRRTPPAFEGLTLWGIGFDETDKYLLRDELVESQKRFETISRATNDAVWDWDIKSNTLWWGDGMNSIFGYPQGGTETVFDWWAEKLHPNDRERVVRSLLDAANRGDKIWVSEYQFKRSDGNYSIVRDRGLSLFDNDGRATRMIGGMIDITEKRIYEQSLITKNQQLAEFAFFNSHKIRSPLTTLMSCVSLLDTGDVNESEKTLIIERVLASAKELDRQIHEVNLLISTDARYHLHER
jgi:PAS domain S-box-containing protein